MAKIKISNYVVKHGRGYWQATKAMKAFGFQSVVCGPDGPEAWGKAEAFNKKWQLARRGLTPSPLSRWPRGSCGAAFDELRLTSEWARMAPRTREDWERGQKAINAIFGDVGPSTVTFQHIDQFYSAVLREKGVSEAYKAIKHWRRLWVKMQAMGYVTKPDPSRVLRPEAPTPRHQTWRASEAVRLVIRAIRDGYPGLACIMAVAWDTQFSPVDVRTLTPAHLRDADGVLSFDNVRRKKTDRAAFGTLSKWTQKLVRAYVAEAGFELLPSSPIFRHRHGSPYSKDTLGDDFRTIRGRAFPGDTRKLMDFRRSGAVEAAAGGVDPNALAAKMGNTVNRSQALQRAYQPVNKASVQQADIARREGRKRLRETE